MSKFKKIPLSIEAFTLLSLGLAEYKKSNTPILRNSKNEYSLLGVLFDLYDLRFGFDNWRLGTEGNYNSSAHREDFVRWLFGEPSLNLYSDLVAYSDRRSKYPNWPDASQLKRIFWFDTTDARRRDRNRKVIVSAD